jgi:transposase
MSAPTGRRRADDKLILALAGGETVEAAAAKAGISLTTAYRRLKDPAFRARLDAARADMVRQATAMLTAAATEAVNTLLDLQSKECPPPTRLGAAKSILEIGNRLRTEVDLAARLQALERALGLMPPTATGGQ